MKRISSFRVQLVLALSLLSYGSVNAQKVVEIPFSIERGCLYVEATYRGSDPFKLMLSFNHPPAIDITNKAFEFNVESGKRLPNGVTGTTTPQSTISGLKLGSYLVEKDTDYFWDPPYGLGRRFFEGKIVQFDFQRNVMRILGQEGSLKADQLATRNNESVTIEFKKSEEDEVKPKTYLISKAISINGRPVSASLAIDLWEFNLAKGVHSSIKIRGGPIYIVERVTVKFGDIEVKDVEVLRNYSKKKFDYVLASNFFQKFLTTFDFKSNRVRIDGTSKLK